MSIVGVTIRNTFADGVNFHKGGSNSMVQQSILRNTGDDALAMWSQASADTNNTFRFNTIQVPVLANGVAIYGGSNNYATDNYIADTVCEGGGLQASNRFGADSLAGLTEFSRNTLVRCGSMSHDNTSWSGAVWLWAMESSIGDGGGKINIIDTIVTDSTYSGILFWGAYNSITNVNFSNMTIDGTGTYAIQVQGPTGGVSMDHVIARNNAWGGYCTNQASFVIKQGDGNVGWNTTSHC